MRVYPAIDIRNGKCVRLLQGKADQETIYHDDPIYPARQFREDGAEWVHVVDLDGAFTGKPTNIEIIASIAALGLKVQMGGGVRSLDVVEKAISAGISRVVIGTKACNDPEFVGELVKKFGSKIAVGIDGKDGKVATEGWTRGTDRDVISLARTLEDMGVATVIHTDIATDGMMTGPNIKAQTALMEKVSMDVIASGGVSRPQDIYALRDLAAEYKHLKGVIVGKAIYEGTVKLKEL